MTKKFALISVSDKTGLDELARSLVGAGYTLVATGGTYRYLTSRKIPALPVEKLTGFPEILDGKVKTLHPAVFGGLLADGLSQMSEIKKFSIPPIDAVIVNFYPFEKVLKSPPSSGHRVKPADMIDIGGVAMARAAAKNFKRVLAVTSVSQYDEVIRFLRRKKKNFPLEMKKRFASSAFAETSRYDALISRAVGSFSDEDYFDGGRCEDSLFLLLKERKPRLRYGENPHQTAVFCDAVFPSVKSRIGSLELSHPASSDVVSLGNKAVSYNNLLDADAGISLLNSLGSMMSSRHFGCAIMKHTNPCGVAVSENSQVEAYLRALSTDRVSAFGGVVIFNKPVASEMAREMMKIFTDCVVAPDFSTEALKIFLGKKNLAVIKIRSDSARRFDMRGCLGGVLIQKPDDKLISEELKIVTGRKPSAGEIKSLLFAYTVAKFAKSNAIVLARGLETLGVGSGVASRIDAFHLAASKMNSNNRHPDEEDATVRRNRGETLSPLVLASDGFFPFDDIVKESVSLGVKAIIQPGGSIRDAESIKACDENGIAMVFAGLRHFRH